MSLERGSSSFAFFVAASDGLPHPGTALQHHDDDAGGRNVMTFENFIRCCIFVQNATDSFKRKDTNLNGWIQINYGQVGPKGVQRNWGRKN